MTEPRIFIAVPSAGRKLSGRAAQTLYTSSTKHKNMIAVVGSSLLTQTFNALWCEALNRRDDGITHFAMLHDDIEPEDFWIDTLIEEIGDADIISAVVPLKSNDGITSTAIDTDYWRPRRLTLTEVANLPQTFQDSDVPWADGHSLLINSGCMVVRFDAEWVENVCFHVEDRNIRDLDGMFKPHVCPEDWGFSRWANQEGLELRATTKVRLTHQGIAPFPNYGVWGKATDEINAGTASAFQYATRS